MPLKNPICKKCGELRLPSGDCVRCQNNRAKTLVERSLAKASRSPLPWIERDKKARILAKAEKRRAQRAARWVDKKKDAQGQKYRRGRLLLAIVLDWLAMFVDCFEKDETGFYWFKPNVSEQLQTMLTMIEIILPETPAIFKFRPRSKEENEADALRHALFVCSLATAREWVKCERRINSLLQSGSISPEVATLMLSDLHQQVLQRFRFCPSKELLDPHQKT